MSAHELEHQKEQRPGFTGVKLSELEPGMVIYRHQHFDEAYNEPFSHRLCRYVSKEKTSAWGRGFKRIPIGLDYSSHFAGNWSAFIGDLFALYSHKPSPEYVVLNGLGLPDELLYEVYQYCY